MQDKNSSGVSKRPGEYQSSVLYCNIMRSACDWLDEYSPAREEICSLLKAPVSTCIAHKQGCEREGFVAFDITSTPKLTHFLTAREICSDFNQFARLKVI